MPNRPLAKATYAREATKSVANSSPPRPLRPAPIAPEDCSACLGVWSKQVVECFGVCGHGGGSHGPALGVFLGNAVFPVGRRVGRAAQATKHFLRHLLVSQSALVVSMQVQLLRLGVVVRPANAPAGECFAEQSHGSPWW
jgi:hypothetical protein